MDLHRLYQRVSQLKSINLEKRFDDVVQAMIEAVSLTIRKTREGLQFLKFEVQRLVENTGATSDTDMCMPSVLPEPSAEKMPIYSK